jgi:hypothetical protein
MKAFREVEILLLDGTNSHVFHPEKDARKQHESIINSLRVFDVLPHSRMN